MEELASSEITRGGIMGDFDNINLQTIDNHFLYNTIDSDALAIIIIDRIRRKTPTSLIRTSDGERMIITRRDHYGYLKNNVWLKKYGLLDADMEKVREDLIDAANTADFLSCTPSGLCEKHSSYRTNDLFNQRDKYFSHFYTTYWKSGNRIEDVVRTPKNGVLILHRDVDTLVPKFIKRYKIKCEGFALDSWEDHNNVIEWVNSKEAELVLVSGGASGKALIVKMARITGKVVLDVGQALGDQWAE
jgi:hypothetical protein